MSAEQLIASLEKTSAADKVCIESVLFNDMSFSWLYEELCRVSSFLLAYCLWYVIWLAADLRRFKMSIKWRWIFAGWNCMPWQNQDYHNFTILGSCIKPDGPDSGDEDVNQSEGGVHRRTHKWSGRPKSRPLSCTDSYKSGVLKWNGLNPFNSKLCGLVLILQAGFRNRSVHPSYITEMKIQSETSLPCLKHLHRPDDTGL